MRSLRKTAAVGRVVLALALCQIASGQTVRPASRAEYSRERVIRLPRQRSGEGSDHREYEEEGQENQPHTAIDHAKNLGYGQYPNGFHNVHKSPFSKSSEQAKSDR